MFYEWFEDMMIVGGNAVIIPEYITILKCNEFSVNMWYKVVTRRLCILNRVLAYNYKWFK